MCNFIYRILLCWVHQTEQLAFDVNCAYFGRCESVRKHIQAMISVTNS